MGHIKDLLSQLSAAVGKLKADQEVLMSMAKEAYEETEVATIALTHTTEGTNNDHAREARAAAFEQEFNVGWLRTEVFNMGGGGDSDPLRALEVGVNQATVDVMTYERMVNGTAITAEQVVASRNKVHTHVDAYKASLYWIQFPGHASHEVQF